MKYKVFVDEYISGFYKSLLEIDNETKWTGQFPSRRLRYWENHWIL